MKRFTRAVLSLLLCGSLVALTDWVPSPVAASPEVSVEAPTEVVGGAGDVVGSGFWAKAACIGCIAGFGLAGGGSLAGMLLLAAAFPEASTACIGACILAFN